MEIETSCEDTNCWCHTSHLSVIYDTLGGHTSAVIYSLGRSGIRACSPFMFPLRLWSSDMQHFKRKPFDITRRSRPVNFFQWLHILLMKLLWSNILSFCTHFCYVVIMPALTIPDISLMYSEWQTFFCHLNYLTHSSCWNLTTNFLLWSVCIFFRNSKTIFFGKT